MSNLEYLSPESVVSGAVIAELMEISPRRVEQLAKLGVIPREGRGKYRVGKAVPAYLCYLREPGYRRMIAEEAQGLEMD